MKREYAIKALKRHREQCKKNSILKDNGVDTSEYSDLFITLIEESIPALFAKDENQFELILKDVQWWLYDEVDKTIYFGNKQSVDCSTPEKFIDWIIEHYG